MSNESCPPMPVKSILVVCDPINGHVTVKIRGLNYRELFPQHDWRAEFISVHPNCSIDGSEPLPYMDEDQLVEYAKHFDLVYLLKINSLSLVTKLKTRTAAKVIFDLTDALWKPNFQKGGWSDIEDILRTVDVIFSENRYICSYGYRFNKRVFNIPAYTKTERFAEKRKQYYAAGGDRAGGTGKIVIGWIGTKHTVSALQKIYQPLERVFGRHRELELRIVGCGDESLLPPFKNVRYTMLEEYTEDQMIEEALGLDIGVFPPPFDIEDYCVRGALKGLIYMSAGIPAIFQKDGDCLNFIQDGVNGMLASDEREWEEKLEALVISESLRREIGRRGFETVEREHSLQHVFSVLEKACSSVMQMYMPPTRPQKGGLINAVRAAKRFFRKVRDLKDKVTSRL